MKLRPTVTDAMKKAVTIAVPDGYASAEEFAKDCGFEIVNADLAAKNARLRAAAERVCRIDWTGNKREDIAAIEELRRAIDGYGYVTYDDPSLLPLTVPDGALLKREDDDG